MLATLVRFVLALLVAWAALVGLSIVAGLAQLGPADTSGAVSSVLSTIGVNAGAAAAGVFAGVARMTPTAKPRMAARIAVFLVAVAVLTLLLGSTYRQALNMGLFWHLLGAAAWVAGAIAAASSFAARHATNEAAT